MAATDPRDLFRLDGKVAVITGASSGIGAHTARTFVAYGAKVVVAARRVDRLEALAAELPGVEPIVCDVTDDASCERLIATALDTFGHVDILVNNAGGSDAQPAMDEPMADFRATMDLNLNAAFLLSKLVAKSMSAGEGGSIINVSSIHGLVAGAPNNQAAYAASKAALINLSRELAVQWAKHTIRVNAVAPGYFETELTDTMLEDESSVNWIARNTPLRRPGVVAELDGVMLLLASDAGSYITGETIAVDGGWTAR